MAFSGDGRSNSFANFGAVTVPYTEVERECPRCWGTGERDGYDCLNCEGNGTVIEIVVTRP